MENVTKETEVAQVPDSSPEKYQEGQTLQGFLKLLK
jgi:hypothetical protein